MTTFEEIQQYGLQFKQEQSQQKEHAKKERAKVLAQAQGPLSSHERSAKITRLFEKAVDNKFGTYDTFRKLVNLFYFALTRDEEHYLELVKQLEKKTVECATQIFGELMQALYVEQDLRDYLGEAFGFLGLGDSKLGQNMTPWNIAFFMAKMDFSKEEYEKAKAEGRRITVYDPCVGGGVFLLAYKKAVINELGLEALSQYEFYGVDIDALCVQMTKVQMLLTDYRHMRDLLIVTAYEAREKLSKTSPAKALKTQG